MCARADLLFKDFRGEEGDLIPLLQRAQATFGFVGPEAVGAIARFLRITENQIYGVASFYAQFRFTAPARHGIKVCLGTACHVKGGAILLDSLERDLGIAPGGKTPDDQFELDRVACLGCCALAPVLTVDEDVYSSMTVNKLKETLKRYD
jgi:NADH:ubiquinone oxidoreductase subunit E